jgi:hypothetical protein
MGDPKGGDEIAKGVGKDLWELIKKPFSKEKDRALIEALEQNPGDEKTKNIAEYKLVEFLEANPSLARKIEELCKQIPDLGKQQINTLSMQGNDNIGIQDATNSTITIKK